MDNLRRFETVSDYNAFNNNETLHPFVGVVDLSKASPRQTSNMYFGFYTVFLKEVKCGDLRYGKSTYTTTKEPRIYSTGTGNCRGRQSRNSYLSNKSLLRISSIFTFLGASHLRGIELKIFDPLCLH